MPKDYDVGYGRPPKPNQWKPGQSGNPAGREKGHKGLKTDLEATLNKVETLESKMTGRRTKARNQLHAVERLVERAALGDLKAQALLWPMLLNVLGAEDRHKGVKLLSNQDAEILAELLGSRLGEEAAGTPLLTDDSEDKEPADEGIDDGTSDEDEDGEGDDDA